MISANTLYLAASFLGFTAFFEPCTVATHSLFTESLFRTGTVNRIRSLIVFFLVRIILVLSILTALVSVVSLQIETPFFFPAFFAGIGSLYLLTSFIYVPVPHFLFYRLIPGNAKFSYPLKLGLTLPACTVPLFMITVLLVLFRDTLIDAAIAGSLFVVMFTLPSVYLTFSGISTARASALEVTARGMTVFTSILLFSMSFYLLFHQQKELTAAFKYTAQTAAYSGIFFGFLAGFIFSFNPVSFASIPVVLAYVTRAHEEKRALVLGGSFVGGMILTHSVLGIISGFGGEIFRDVMGRFWGLYLGPLLIVLGFMWPGWLKIRLPWFSMRARRVTGVWGAFLLGIPFAIAVCPFCTPALLVALTSSVAVGSPVYGFFLMTAFAMGRSIPIVVGARSMGYLESLSFISRYQKILEIGAGIVMILSGLYLLNEYFLLFPYFL